MATILNRTQTFATNGIVTAAGLHNLIDDTAIYAGLITTQTELTTVGTADQILIAVGGVSDTGAPRRATVQNLFDDALSVGTYTGLNLSGALTYGTATGNRTVSTSATITTGTIPNLTAGTTTSTAATITSGTITNLASTTGTIATLNSTTGTITNLSTTLAGDFTISQGTGTLGTSGVTLGTYGGSTSIPTIVVDSKGRVTTASTSAITSGFTGFRNRIINGDMRIDQRNAGASVTPSSTSYTLDRWSLAISGAASKLSIQQSTTAPDGYKNSTVATVVSSYSPASNDVLIYQQAIEGFNFGDLAWGTSSAQAITISFWVRSSLIGTYSVMLLSNGTGGTYRNYIATYSISSANVWEKKTITVSGDTSGTWDTGNTTGLYIAFDLGSGSGTATTAGSWANGVARKSTGANTFVSQSNGATWYITGVQLEQGSTATDFERRPIGTELAMCQRYYHRISGGNGQYPPVGAGVITSSLVGRIHVPLPVFMRTAPTVTISTGTNYLNAIGNVNNPISSLQNTFGGGNGMMLDLDLTNSMTLGNALVVYASVTNTDSFAVFNSEL